MLPPPAADVSLCLSAGGPDERSEGSGQRGGLALQGGGRHVQLAEAPLQGRHRRLPGEIQRGVGGGGTPIAGTYTNSNTQYAFCSAPLIRPPPENPSLQVQPCLCVH